jgi:hypothetical protein
LRTTGEPVCALAEQRDEFSGVPEGIGDRKWRATDAHRRPQLAGDLGDQQGPRHRWLGVQGREASQGRVVVWIGKTDCDAEAVVEG